MELVTQTLDKLAVKIKKMQDFYKKQIVEINDEIGVQENDAKRIDNEIRKVEDEIAQCKQNFDKLNNDFSAIEKSLKSAASTSATYGISSLSNAENEVKAKKNDLVEQLSVYLEQLTGKLNENRTKLDDISTITRKLSSQVESIQAEYQTKNSKIVNTLSQIDAIIDDKMVLDNRYNFSKPEIVINNDRDTMVDLSEELNRNNFMKDSATEAATTKVEFNQGMDTEKEDIIVSPFENTDKVLEETVEVPTTEPTIPEEVRSTETYAIECPECSALALSTDDKCAYCGHVFTATEKMGIHEEEKTSVPVAEPVIPTAEEVKSKLEQLLEKYNIDINLLSLDESTKSQIDTDKLSKTLELLTNLGKTSVEIAAHFDDVISASAELISDNSVLLTEDGRDIKELPIMVLCCPDLKDKFDFIVKNGDNPKIVYREKMLSFTKYPIEEYYKIIGKDIKNEASKGGMSK